jgi:hypothetical protein
MNLLSSLEIYSRGGIFNLLRSQGIDSVSLLAWRDGTTTPISTRFLAHIDCSKIPALDVSSGIGGGGGGCKRDRDNKKQEF